MNKTVQDAVNAQIQAEFQSAYIYLALSADFEARNLKGFAHWLRVQWEEENEHALKLFDHLLRRGATVELLPLEAPNVRYESLLGAFEHVLHHEQYVTRRINELYELALRENDYPLQLLLQWFIDEQVEEEENATELVEKLRLIGESGPGLYLLDRELADRKPEDED